MILSGIFGVYTPSRANSRKVPMPPNLKTVLDKDKLQVCSQIWIHLCNIYHGLVICKLISNWCILKHLSDYFHKILFLFFVFLLSFQDCSCCTAVERTIWVHHHNACYDDFAYD